jgi:hypothetical protein
MVVVPDDGPLLARVTVVKYIPAARLVVLAVTVKLSVFPDWLGVFMENPLAAEVKAAVPRV